jgi:hypothetical protein
LENEVQGIINMENSWEWVQSSVFSFDYCVSHQSLGSSKAYVHSTCIKAAYSLLRVPAGVVEEDNGVDGGMQSFETVDKVFKLQEHLIVVPRPPNRRQYLLRFPDSPQKVTQIDLSCHCTQTIFCTQVSAISAI